MQYPDKENNAVKSTCFVLFQFIKCKFTALFEAWLQAMSPQQSQKHAMWRNHSGLQTMVLKLPRAHSMIP